MGKIARFKQGQLLIKGGLVETQIEGNPIIRFSNNGDLTINGEFVESSRIVQKHLENASFEIGMEEWQEYHTGAGIIERIEENGSIVVYGHGDGGGRWGIQKDFLLQNSPQTIVKFDYRIKTGLAHAGVTNLFFELRAYGDDGIYSSFINSNINTEVIADTGWRTFEMDITSLIQGKSGMRMRLYQNDVWSADHKQSFYVDNIEIIQTVEMPESRLFSIDKPNNKVILYGELIENVNLFTPKDIDGMTAWWDE